MLKGFTRFWFGVDEAGEYETFSHRDIMRDFCVRVSHVVTFENVTTTASS